MQKKLQDSAMPNVSAPLQTSSSLASDLNGSRAVDASANGQQSVNIKDKAKDANGGRNISDSSYDLYDGKSGPTKEERTIQLKEMLKELGDLLDLNPNDFPAGT